MAKKPVVNPTSDNVPSPATAEQAFPAPPALQRDPTGHNKGALKLPTPDPGMKDPRRGNPFRPAP